jgi:hypothetical protein
MKYVISSKELTVKHILLLFVFLTTLVFAQDFTGTFRDDDGDRHVFELRADGTLLGQLTVDDSVVTLPFEVENGQAFGVLELSGAMIGFIMTPLTVSQLEVQVVPFDANAQPLADQIVYYTFTRVTEVAQNPLSVKPSTTQNSPLSLGGLELYADGSSSSSNSSGDAHLTGAREESYVFCSDGSYGYYMEDTTMFSTGGLGDFGGDFSSESSDAHQGLYQVGADASGQLYLQLQASDGRTFNYPIMQTASGIMIDSAEFSVIQSSQCQ